MEINKIPVVDAAKKVVLRITKKDVALGSRKNHGLCAAALACLRQFHAKEVKVHVGRTYVKKGKQWLRFTTPRALRSEIIAFDRGGTFEPGEYTLSPLQPTQRTAHRNTRKRYDSYIPAKSRRARPHKVGGIRTRRASRG